MSKKKSKNKTYSEANNIDLIPKNDKQQDLVDAIYDFPIVITMGAAGTGKTYVSASMAAEALFLKKIDRIILSRANVPTGKSLGHFPGTVEQKLEPWLRPALDVLEHQLGNGMFNYAIRNKVIQMQPLETIRGRSFDYSFIIVDEAQNLTKEEVISIVTRLGIKSTLVLMGDPFQSDLKTKSGLEWFAEFSKRHKLNIPLITFSVEDIVRSKIVKEILTALYSDVKNKS